MSRRTVVTAWLKPTPKSSTRSVYVCLPDSVSAADDDRVDRLLVGLLRPTDRVLYADERAPSLSVVSFAEKHGLFADPIGGEARAPDLIVVLIDPYGDNAGALEARALAVDGPSDLLIAELPDRIG